jgi:tetratricopeptide (TPR) repeat protein
MKTIGLILGTLAPLLAGTSPDIQEAGRLYDETAYEASLRVLSSVPASRPDALFLAGKNHYQLSDYKKAQAYLEQAVEADPANSNYRLWLGRALGRRAETSSPLFAPRLAVKARQHFEAAVRLDPDNLEALDDLFEYHISAPGFLGGGIDKAEALAPRVAKLEAAEGHYSLYRLAEKRKKLDLAEQELRLAVSAAPMQVGRLIDLARFLAGQGRWAESEAAFESANRIAPDNPRLLFGQAEIYIRSKRNLGSARQLLNQYLAAKLTPEDPPRSEAKSLISRL